MRDKLSLKRVADAAGVLSLVGSLLGLIIYSVYAHKPGPFYDINQFLGVWLSCATLFFGTQIFYAGRSHQNYRSGLIFHAICAVCSFMMFVGYCMGRRYDGVVWSFVMMLQLTFCIFILVKRQHDPTHDIEILSLLGKEEEVETPAPKRCPGCCFAVIIWMFRVLAVICMALLINGSWLLGVGTVKYPPRGDFLTVTYADGRSQSIHYMCQGPKNSSLPTFWLEPGGGHNMCDFYGLQMLLEDRGRRSCIYDRPGMGWSDYMLPVQPDWYYPMMQKVVETGENGPFIFVGWAAGGPYIYPFVKNHPEMAAGMAFLDVSPISYDPEQALNNWTDAEAAVHMKEEMAQRYMLFDIMRGFVSPAGLVGLFISPPQEGYLPPDRYEEYKWHEMTEKYWTSQYFALIQDLEAPDPLANTTFPPNIPVGILVSYMNKTEVCKSMQLDINSKDCSDQAFIEDYWFKVKMNYMSLNNRTTSRICDPCDLGFPVWKPYWTVDNLLSALGNVTI